MRPEKLNHEPHGPRWQIGTKVDTSVVKKSPDTRRMILGMVVEEVLGLSTINAIVRDRTDER
jgi:hypothetical protein